MIRCPICGSERVILLTFDRAAADMLPDAERPLAKCVNCGHRLTTQQVLDQIGPISN
jgi:DNA-directed RNA polymerase subunit RPC12/RpoP